MQVKARKPFFQGDRFRTPSDPPFELDDDRARQLHRDGLIEFVVRLSAPVAGPDPDAPPPVPAPERAVDPRPARAEKRHTA